MIKNVIEVSLQDFSILVSNVKIKQNVSNQSIYFKLDEKFEKCKVAFKHENQCDVIESIAYNFQDETYKATVPEAIASQSGKVFFEILASNKSEECISQKVMFRVTPSLFSKTEKKIERIKNGFI